MTKNPYPLVYEDHDGSWTWSIEIGEPFEDDHEVLERDEGFESRRDAQQAMERAMPGVREKLRQTKLDELEARQQALDNKVSTSPPAQSLKPSIIEPKVAEQEPADAPSEPQQQDLSWGVFEVGRLIAVFSDHAEAASYAKQAKSRRLVQLALHWAPTS